MRYDRPLIPGSCVQASQLNDLADSVNGAMPSDASAMLKRLFKYIQDAADDARAFAAQAASDAKRHHIGPSPGASDDVAGQTEDGQTEAEPVEPLGDAPDTDKVSGHSTSASSVVPRSFEILTAA